MENLKRRRLDVKDKCIFCKDNVEDMQHALLHCPSIQAHWSKYLPMVHNVDQTQSFRGVALSIKSYGIVDELTTFVLIA